MGIRLQMLHALIEAHPDRAERLRPHVEALEAGIVAEPAMCLARVRTLFEAVHESIAPILGVDLSSAAEFPKRNALIIEALDFSLDGHPEAERINKAIKKLLGAINGTASALAELSNIPSMRHMGSLDWPTLERQHAMMLGGLCDTLISFLFEVAWNRQTKLATDEPRYADFADFNDHIDELYKVVEIEGSQFQPSQVLFELDWTQYKSSHQGWSLDKEAATKADGEAAA